MDFFKAIYVNIFRYLEHQFRIERKILVDERSPFRLPMKDKTTKLFYLV